MQNRETGRWAKYLSALGACLPFLNHYWEFQCGTRATLVPHTEQTETVRLLTSPDASDCGLMS